jgi:gliding motility-associated lipoprotein GldD
MIKKNWLIYVCLVLTTLLTACSDTPVPRPYAYFRIDLPEHDYRRTTVFSNCTFDISRYAVIKKSEERWAGEFDEWYNIWYPRFDGTIHLSYKKITPDMFQDISEESRTLAYKHTIRADAISESMFLNDTTRTYGILYEMTGSAASPCQFFISDSTNNFIRGALYFNVSPNPDSIAPVSVYVEQDIIRMIESLKWNK